MVDELKILAEILKGVTDGALIGAITYMVLNFLKTPLIVGIVGYVGVTITKLFVEKDKNKVTNVIEVEDA